METLYEDKIDLTQDDSTEESIETSNLVQKAEIKKEFFYEATQMSKKTIACAENYIDLDDILNQHTIFKDEGINNDLKESDASNNFLEVPIISDLDNEKYNTVKEKVNIESDAISTENIIDISNFMERQHEDKILQESRNKSVRLEKSFGFNVIENMILNCDVNVNVKCFKIPTSDKPSGQVQVNLDLDSQIPKDKVCIKGQSDGVEKNIEYTNNLLGTDENLDVITISSSGEVPEAIEAISLDSKYTRDDYHSSFLEFLAKKAHLNGGKTDKETANESDHVNVKNTKEHEELDDAESICDGYHSSDFEFISEDEAKLDGLIINFKPGRNDKSKGHTRTISVERERSKERKHIEDSNANNFNSEAGPSSRPGYERYRHPNYQDNNPVENHRIPEGEEYFNLFQGAHNPLFSNFSYLILENKSIVPTTSMNVEFEGIGFDLKRHAIVENFDEELTKEAEVSAQKILQMYPSENRRFKRKRR